MRALYNTIHWSFSSCNLSRSHSFPLGLYQPTCDPRSKSRPRNWKQTHERTRSPRYLDVTQRFFISIPKTWSSHVFILQSFSNLSTSHYILKETLCLNVVSNYCFYKFHYRRLKMNDCAHCEKRGSSNSEPNFLAEIQVNIGQKHLRILHSFSQPPRVITSPSTYTHKFAFDIRLAARIMAWYCSAISIVRLTHIRVFSATSASNFEPDQTSQNFIFRKLYLKIKYFWGEITPSVILKMNEWHDIQSEKFTFEFNCSSIVSQLKILCNLHTCFTTKWLIFFSWELSNNFIW